MNDRIRKRRMILAKKRRAKGIMHNQTMPCGNGNDFNSPNVSRISPVLEDKDKKQPDETMDTDMMDNSILKNLELDLEDNAAMPSDGENVEDDPEKL